VDPRELPFKRQPGVNPKQIRTFAELEFIPRAENIVFVGPTGVGKTGLASGLLLKALQNGHRGIFTRAQDLFDEMYASLADRSTRRLLNRLAKVDVLVMDEMGYLNLCPEQTNIFFTLIEERYRHHPTIITIFRRCIVRVMLRPACLPSPPGWLRRDATICLDVLPHAF
jgi:DNA replication protein DnaC